MRFQFSTTGPAGPWTNIGGVLTSPNDDGAYSREWNPVADSGLTLPTGPGFLVRANGHSNIDGLDHPGTSFPVTVSSTFDTVSIDAASQVGVWKANDGQHKIVVSGKQSNAGTVRLAAMAPNGGAAVPGGHLGPSCGRYQLEDHLQHPAVLRGGSELRVQRSGPARDDGLHGQRVPGVFGRRGVLALRPGPGPLGHLCEPDEPG